MSAIPLRQQTARTGIISGLMVSTMDLLHRGLSRNNNKLQEEIPAGTHCRENIVSSFRVNFRENQCVFYMFFCTSSCNTEHNKSNDFTGVSRLFLYLLVFAKFFKNRFESGQRHLTQAL